ncbi:MAG: Gfo/Idh/MocA family oxidoreductase [Candidatus Zipacnadales bacterium]
MAGSIKRREFLKALGAGAGALSMPYILPAGALSQPSANEASVRAVIGVGGMGNGHLGRLLERQTKDVRVAAVCDVDRNRREAALRRALNAGADCKAYADFREVLDRDDIDVVYVVTPPHWHALITIAACQAGKDVYCEKPMTKFIHEGRAVVEAVERYGRVFHIGTFGRYGERRMRRLIASGLLGTPIRVNMTHRKYNYKVREWSGRTNLEAVPVPDELDYNLWLGPAPVKPYHPHRVHGSFRGYWDYDGGGFTDMAAHYFDPVMYFMGYDDTGPVEIEAVAPWPAHPDAVGMWESITYTFADGNVIHCTSGEWGKQDPEDIPWIEGPKGKVLQDGKTDPPDLFDQLGDTPEPPEMLDWETALKVRKQPGGNALVSHRVASTLHLGNLAIRLGRKLKWDPDKEEFIGDEEANQFVNIPMRAPWHL